jgi:hypothetical protein
MVLERYCRKAERKREGRQRERERERERERDQPWPHGEVGERREREGGLESKKVEG